VKGKPDRVVVARRLLLHRASSLLPLQVLPPSSSLHRPSLHQCLHFGPWPPR
jgi:hypothetical protein